MENFVINIGRQVGSGGREIGATLAEKLGCIYYDKELITLAARQSGIGKEFFERADESGTFSMLGGVLGFRGVSISHYQSSNFLYNESLFQIQSDVIKGLAEKGNCVFVGRCADYVLRTHPHCLDVFFTADIENRIHRVLRTYEITSAEKAKDFIQKTDKKRAAYYNYYTNKEWGMASSYHLCINTSAIGAEQTIDLVVQTAREKFGLK